MRWFVVLIVLLGGCDTTGPSHWGATKVVREVEGSRFSLRFNNGVVEAIRTNPEVLPKFDDIARKASFAAEAETGCETAWIKGDPAIVLLGMKCAGGKAPPKPRKKTAFVCSIDGVRSTSLGASGLLSCY